jgi:hypothetical protein
MRDVKRGLQMNPEVMKAPSVQYKFECFDSDGNLKWAETIHNLVTTVGKNDMLDKYFAGSSYSATWFVGLIDNAGWSAVNAADTMASHSGWAEADEYDEATREAVSWSAASSGSKTASAVTEFTINATITIRGAFLTSVGTKNGTTGILYSAAAFSGTRALVDNDLLRVTPTYSLT